MVLRQILCRWGWNMQQYYTLEEAAQVLRTTPDRVKEMARKKEVRAFQDRGTLRFRGQEIDERARLEGLGSGPDLQLGESTSPRGGGPSTLRPAASGRPTTHAPAGDAGVFDLAPGDEDSDRVPIGGDPK